VAISSSKISRPPLPLWQDLDGARAKPNKRTRNDDIGGVRRISSSTGRRGPGKDAGVTSLDVSSPDRVRAHISSGLKVRVIGEPSSPASDSDGDRARYMPQPRTVYRKVPSVLISEVYTKILTNCCISETSLPSNLLRVRWTMKMHRAIPIRV